MCDVQPRYQCIEMVHRESQLSRSNFSTIRFHLVIAPLCSIGMDPIALTKAHPHGETPPVRFVMTHHNVLITI